MKTIPADELIHRFADEIGDRNNDDKIRAVDPQYTELGAICALLMRYAKKCGITLVKGHSGAAGVIDGKLLPPGK